MKINTKTLKLLSIPAAIVTGGLIIAVAVLGVKNTNSNKHEKVTFPATLINKTPGFPFIINPDDHQPQPTYKGTEGAWYERLILDNIDVPQIKRTIHKLWGLDINEFNWIEEHQRFEHYGYHLDTAYELRFDDWCTIFYDRVR